MDTLLSVMIPWREEPSRVPLLHAVMDWYNDALGVEPYLIDTDHQPFNRAAARNECVHRARNSVIVINDADTIPEYEPLMAAIENVQEDGVAQLPFTRCKLLNESGTFDYLCGRDPWDCAGPYMTGSVGGVMVTTTDIWAQHGGQDERFIGWGFEDAAWHMAHTTLIGPPRRHEGAIYSLRHKPTTRVPDTHKIGGELVYAYEQAKGNPGAMRQLVFRSGF